MTKVKIEILDDHQNKLFQNMHGQIYNEESLWVLLSITFFPFTFFHTYISIS